MEIFFIVLVGLVIGSFLNAVIFRLENLKTLIAARSICPMCRHQLRAIDLVPLLSFIFLKRRCRFCRQHISWQYFLVELATPLLFLLVYLRLGLTPASVVAMLLCCFLIVITVYDLHYQLILDKVSLPAIGLALLFSILIGRSWIEIALGGFIGGGFFFLQVIISKGRWVGGGDLRLGLLMGFLLGWPLVLVALFLSYVIGAASAIALMLSKKANKKSKIAFGPFLVIATLATLLYGQQMLDWYLRLPYASAAAGDGVSSNIQLVDANRNGYIDQVTFEISNPNLETWRTQGSLPYGLGVTQDGVAMNISQVNIFSPSSDPVLVVISLAESGTLSTDGVFSHPVELTYVQSGSFGSGSNINDGIDELLNTIFSGDSGSHDTELDWISPILLRAEFRDQDLNGRVETIRTYWSEDVKMQGAGSTDWQVGRGSIDARFAAAVSDLSAGPTLDLGITASVDKTSSGILPTVRYVGMRPAVFDQSSNGGAESSILNVADAAAPVILSAAVGDIDGDGTAEFLSLTFSEKTQLNGSRSQSDYFKISYNSLPIQITRDSYLNAAENIKFYFTEAPKGNLGAIYTLTYERGHDATIADMIGNELSDKYSIKSSVPAVISVADVILNNLNSGQTGTFKLKFNVQSTTPDFKIKLKMSEFKLSSPVTTACPNLRGFFISAGSEEIMILSYSHFATVEAGTYECTLSSVTNPQFGGSYGPYHLELTTKDDEVVSYNSKVTGDSIVGPAEPAPTPIIVVPPTQPTSPIEAVPTEPAKNLNCENLYRPLVQSDAQAFSVVLPTIQLQVAIDFICYGTTTETISLGAGERRAMIRDYFQTLYLDQIYLDDLARNALGQKPVYRNLAKEQAQVGSVLGIFQKMYGHSPVFSITQEDIAWNTLMHRIRFPRDLDAERLAIGRYYTLFNRNPSSPLDWAAVRVLAYVKI